MGESMKELNNLLRRIIEQKPPEEPVFCCPNPECGNCAFESGVCSACGADLEPDDEEGPWDESRN